MADNSGENMEKRGWRPVIFVVVTAALLAVYLSIRAEIVTPLRHPIFNMCADGGMNINIALVSYQY